MEQEKKNTGKVSFELNVDQDMQSIRDREVNFGTLNKSVEKDGIKHIEIIIFGHKNDHEIGKLLQGKKIRIEILD